MKNNKNNLIIISIKYAPGLFKEFTSIGKNISQNYKYDITYFLSKKYKPFLINSLKVDNSLECSNFHFLFESFSIKSMINDTFKFFFKTKILLKNIFLEENPNIVAIYNPHPLNAWIFSFVKKLIPNCETLIYLHEPYKPFKYHYGFLGYFYFYLVEFFQTITLKHTDIVILPSKNAFNLFKKRYPYFPGIFRVSNLLIPDEPHEALQRKYFTIAGGMNKGKGLDVFFKLLEFSVKNNYGFKFRIVTTSKIDKYLKNISFKSKKFLLVENPKFISDSYMNKVHAESKAYFLLHSTATQSGAISVAFMNGTPVIARNIEAFSQYISDKKNSILLPKEFSLKDIVKAMIFINENFEGLSISARKTFLNTFSADNFNSNYATLFNKKTIN